MQTSGEESVDIPSLYVYLDDLEKALPTSMQAIEFQHQSNLEGYKALQQSNVEGFVRVIAAGQNVLRQPY